MTTTEPRTITLTASEAKRQFFNLLDQIQTQSLRVVVTRRGTPIAALLPYCGKGVTIARRGKPIASIVGIRLESRV